MRTVTTRLFALALAVAVAAPLLAQPRPGQGGFGPQDGAALLRNKSVQEELKISEDQTTKLKEIGDKIRAKYADEFKDAGRDFAKIREVGKKVSEETKKALADANILKPEQTKRLRQIEVQTAGLTAFSMEDVQKVLKLTDKQIADAKAASDDIRKDADEMRKDAGMDFKKFAEIRTKVEKMRSDALNKLTGTFSDDQKKAYKELTGEKFELKVEFTRPGGREKDKGKDKGKTKDV